ncbi:class I SAM-dependent DNA methyltransferase (plasmid) [Ahniella affigens]|uniref:site-specific DNA-methyltransferase (adenine-specific) n=1 Tax=Ahniella affigens TaxID=2021234 RepID=A0A2P1PZW2_9GAMM|nr:DNA methyltransferase [Ahniella affigens]AVQ00383.1 class I SAM-dependent DNA methyltransferase [Ahniella affigens]
MLVSDFISKWRNGGDERRDAQPFFEDLCRLVGHPTPREADPEHTWFTYEFGANKANGGKGWADVWKKGFFGWEAKGTDRSLERAYEQLKMYADALQNPPLLVVCDLQTIVVHTNFTNTVKCEYRFKIEDLAQPEPRRILDAVFKNPDALRPGVTRAAITQKAAERFTSLAQSLDRRGNDPHAVSHFLNRLIFCMFAEDIGILPNKLFTKMVKSAQSDPALFERRSRELFAAMHAGGDVAFENIDWFNGGLFEDNATIGLAPDELKVLLDACELDWSDIEPSIFGTLFERGLDPGKRSQLGAHYTDPETIMKIVDPVIRAPLLAEWEAVKRELTKQLAKAAKSVSKAAQNRFNVFLERLRSFTVLDPACGSGNFLYLALRTLKDIEHHVLIEAEALGLGRQFPAIGPQNVKGIELNDYAAELARITIWIGEIQWMIQNGYGAKKQPILQPLDQIEHRDALINADGSEAEWPQCDVVVGNPPFVGDKKMLGELGEQYVAALRKCFAGRVPGGADLVCYWFEKANNAIANGKLWRAGFVATNSIRGGKNREVLKRITDSCRIFNAWSDEEWVNEGANVRVSLVSYGKQSESTHLNGSPVSQVFSDLTACSSATGIDITRAARLSENSGRCFVGYQKTGEFDVSGDIARAMLREVGNPNGRPNSDVLFPYWNGIDATRRPRDVWVIDTGTAMTEAEAAQYASPFSHLESKVRFARANSPVKDAAARRMLAETWWRLWRPRPDLRKAWMGMSRVIATPEVSKHRVFLWMPRPVAPDKNIMVTAREDDTTFGVLQSHIHEIWSLRMGTSLEDRPRYTPTTCFETFPFPEGLSPNIPAAQYATDPRAIRIAKASKILVDARDRWLNPTEWTERLPEVVPGFPDRIVAKSGHAADLKKRTLTNLYNARPPWLVNLHHELDVSVAASYGWEWPLSDDEILRRLFDLNQQRAAAQ